MSKKIKYESFVYRFLSEAESVGKALSPSAKKHWDELLSDLTFAYERGTARISWTKPLPGYVVTSLDKPEFYFRGDTEKYRNRQSELRSTSCDDPIRKRNQDFFREILFQVAEQTGFKHESFDSAVCARLDTEEKFHDAWAANADLDSIDVKKSNEVCTAPEMRFIRRYLGDLSGKRLLDVGCGLGEASVYFALQGANVTAMDLSQGMLNAAIQLAAANGVTIRTHKSAAEETCLGDNEKFDVIYAGNLMHHVDIKKTINLLKPHLAPGGILVTWDPLAYNPVINAYRGIAKNVRTPDEHPLRWKDIRLFQRSFNSVELRYFWLTTLIIFIAMALVQRRNPNKERFWKVVVNEGEKWRWLYIPLEKVDGFLLKVFPFFRLLCWNVVIISRDK